MVGVNIYGSLKLGVLLGLAAGFLVSVICHFIIERLGSTGANLIYGTRRPIYSDFEKFEGPLNQARYLKQKNDYAKASNMVDDILTNAPSLPEALYLKAQILWEGYRDADSSQNCLRKILVVSPDKNGTYHRWALSLLDDIESIQDNKDKSS